MLSVASSSHACRERLTEIVTTSDHEFEEIVEEYEETITSSAITLQEIYETHLHRYKCSMSPTRTYSSSCYALVFGSVSNLPILTIGDYYNYSHDKNDERKMETGRDMVCVLVGVTSCVPWPQGLAWLYYFPYPCQLMTVHCSGW